jgi:hypothetical protein
MGDRLSFYRNNGDLNDPFFHWETDSFQNISIFDLKPWFCDLDADGDYDLIAGESDIPGPPGVNLFINRGTPEEPVFVHVTDDLVPGVFTQGSVSLSPTTTDINGDGDYDLFVISLGSTFYYFENIGSDTVFQFQFITSDWQGLGEPGIGGLRFPCFYDIDSDGDADLFVNVNSYYYEPWEENLMFYRNVGSPDSAVMQLESNDLFPELMIDKSAPFLLDMDQDNDGDLFVGDTWGGIRYFENLEVNAVTPPRQLHPLHGIELSFGPNPANPITWVTFNLPYPQEAELAVYNLLGQKVATLASGYQMPGTRTYFWNATTTSSGMYFIRLETEKAEAVGKVVVLR